MLQFLSELLLNRHIDLFAPISLSDCEIRKKYLLEREGITEGTVVMLAVPYFTHACLASGKNISAYAVSRDYHGFYRDLFDEILPILRKKYPNRRFAGFADHSPIAELQAAAHAGLGVIGKNGLLITKKYSSYVFIGELITSAVLPAECKPIESCMECGNCIKACPMEKIGNCLSALTQKKGELTEQEKQAIHAYGSVWGCDICQEVCPYTITAIKTGTIFTKIPYFQEETIPGLTATELDQMPDAEFAKRAFSWRGRETIRRNLMIMEENRKEVDKSC